MINRNYVSIYPVGNGDTVLFEVDNKTILTDINYRVSKIGDEDFYDFTPGLRDACKTTSSLFEYFLDIFVLTHPDEDHLGGFTELIHTGSPDSYERCPDGGEALILAAEIWVSPYSVKPNYTTAMSKPVINEIKRREKLMGTPDGDKDGNRLRILDTESEFEGAVTRNIKWYLLAPSPEEADIEDTGDEENRASSNSSSLVIQWKLITSNGENVFLLGGDSTVEVWDRIWSDYKNSTSLKWHVLLAPHHCSRGTMARKNLDTEKYEYSNDTLDALGQKIDDGFIVSSSKPIKKNDDNPPSWDAKKKYLDILSKDAYDDPESRFLNPELHKDGEPASVVFFLKATGPSLQVPEKSTKRAVYIGGGLSEATTYGSK